MSQDLTISINEIPRCPHCQSTTPFIRAGKSYCSSTGKDKDGNCKKTKAKADANHQHLYCEWCGHEWVATAV